MPWSSFASSWQCQVRELASKTTTNGNHPAFGRPPVHGCGLHCEYPTGWKPPKCCSLSRRSSTHGRPRTGRTPCCGHCCSPAWQRRGDAAAIRWLPSPLPRRFPSYLRKPPLQTPTSHAIALLAAALVCVMRGKRDTADAPIRPQTLTAAGIILAGAVSSKSIILAGTLAIGIYVVAEAFRTSKARGWPTIAVLIDGADCKSGGRRTAPLDGAHVFPDRQDLGQQRPVHGPRPADPMWTLGWAAGRIPSLRDILMLPVVPFYATLWGQREPYGGRIGLLTVIFLLIGIAAVRKLPAPQRRTAYWLLPAPPSTISSSVHSRSKCAFDRICLVHMHAIAAVGYAAYAVTSNHGSPLRGKIVRLAFCTLALGGIADSILRKLLLPG